jgi:hypothetical protein
MRVCGATSHLVAAGTAIGIQSQFWEEDSQHVVALAMRRMNELLLPASSSVACKPASRRVAFMPLACIDCLQAAVRLRLLGARAALARSLSWNRRFVSCARACSSCRRPQQRLLSALRPPPPQVFWPRCSTNKRKAQAHPAAKNWVSSLELSGPNNSTILVTTTGGFPSQARHRRSRFPFIQRTKFFAVAAAAARSAKAPFRSVGVRE